MYTVQIPTMKGWSGRWHGLWHSIAWPRYIEEAQAKVDDDDAQGIEATYLVNVGVVRLKPNEDGEPEWLDEGGWAGCDDAQAEAVAVGFGFPQWCDDRIIHLDANAVTEAEEFIEFVMSSSST
jgi:hypothetical protein